MTPLMASLNFLTDVVIRSLTGLVTGPPGEAVFGVVERSTTVSMGTVLLWPLVAAAPPMGSLLIAMPGPVCVMGSSGPFLKMDPANASGPGPAATVLVPPRKLKARFRLLPGPPADSYCRCRQCSSPHCNTRLST